ncbi:MAG: hypothetical protein P4M14_03355 [Gammaproteobacteria bacterium]|nr:hypothetical protein [Gammaproteobacteria bacterium]
MFICTIGLILSSMTQAEMQDPTKPPLQQLIPVGVHNGYVLTAIMISKDKTVAVINGKVVHIGDEIDNAKVTAINSNTVELEAPNGNLTLTLMINPVVQEENSKAPLNQ